ncbi:MAG: phosphate signaling complex protein PhoU [Candidatus Krumholzibacteria bacterium]|jgi:phosphate transport system protein|nr:phosphate signaling complex protein PhoU [Candidatus Krumholzibacteria bacterium]
MALHIRREIEHLKKDILSVGTVVEESLFKAVKSLETRDAALAREVIDSDEVIDHMEVELEEECLKALALHQPVAIDLRLIITIMKINNDLERVGDLSVNIAERALFLSQNGKAKDLLNFSQMAEKTRKMLGKSLDALVNENTALAYEVIQADSEVDRMNREIFLQVHEMIKADPGNVESLIHLLSVSRHMERVADHATNIAEDVIYMIEGEIVRHKAENFRSPDEQL